MVGITFENIPGSGLKAPGFFFELTSGGQFQSSSRILLIGHKLTDGTMAANVPISAGSETDAFSLAGKGSMLADMFRVARKNMPTETIHLLAVAETGTKRARTITVASVPAAGGTGVIEIAGEPVSVTIAPGDSTATVATNLSAAINAYYNSLSNTYLPVVATVATSVVTVTARHAGTVAGDTDINVPLTSFTNAFGSTALTIVETVASSGTPDLSTALAALGDDPYDFIISPFGDTTNLDRYQTFLSDIGGRWSYSRMVYGHVITVATDTVSGLISLGLGRNDRHTTIIGRPSAAGDYHPAWVWAADLGASSAAWLIDAETGNCSRNQTGKRTAVLRSPRDRSKAPNYASRNELLKAGISTWLPTTDGVVAIDKLVTGYRLNPLNQPDETFSDIQAMAQAMHMLRYHAAQISYEHGQKAIADANPGQLGAIVTPIDIENTFIQSAFELERRGIQENAAQFARDIVVTRSTDTPNRVNVFAPIDRVNPLDIMATNAKLYSQYRQTEQIV